ncbi:hypothetical protein LTR37_012053 [Vermiconidia calcicola]|uniref:Uncharacterized protein n=1 Tax=Vermiconidia calcicola TaxID=1690605 RepID=A0ACC3N0B4_9PEZI|nr:hypothetical protein LTR37_012053 [Vermiconidia calcicola]
MKMLQLPPALLVMIAALLPPSTSVSHHPLPVEYSNVLESSLNPEITILYKEPDAGTCTTTFPTQKQYTGYISLPPYTLAPIQQNYSINTFFWFVEARNSSSTAPLTIWLSGGPGTSSMFGFFNEVGPCEVVQLSDGTYGTQYNQWGWDRASNMLFIDQPNQVGFSYDTTTDASFDLFSSQVFEPPEPPNPDLPGFMYLNGTFGTASFEDEDATSATTANTTEIAAQATWHFLQSWLATFPTYNPATRPNTTVEADAVGINLFAESYGGKYGPAFATYFEEQNRRRLNGSLSKNDTLAIKLDSVGIVNGIIDDLIQDYYFPAFAWNNTYGIQAINEVDQLNALNDYTTNCVTQIQACRNAMASTDPEGYGDVTSTNQLCEDAQYTCNDIVNIITDAGYYPYDIRQQYPSPDPPAAYQEYLNNDTVLAAIGAKINYTESNPYVQAGFISTGDTIRGGQIEDLAYLLSIGVRVALIYGDADYLCNWLGGEAVSFAIAAALTEPPSPTSSSVPPTYASGFPSAGYADIVTNPSYVGGAVRQYGNLSFSRIYAAGHFVPYYQPETAFQVFARIIQGVEISTGEPIDLSTFGSTGPRNSSQTNTTSYAPEPTCWVRAWNQSCSDEETDAMLAGKGVVANGIFYLDNDDTTDGLPESTVAAGVPGHPMSTTTTPSDSLIGAFTATATPTSSGMATSGRRPRLFNVSFAPFGAIILGLAIGVLVIL